MQYGATFELASRFVSVVKLQQKVARLAKSICEATSQKQERFSMFSPSPSLFFSLLELTFASLSCGSTPLPRQLALNEAQLAPFPSFLPPPPPRLPSPTFYGKQNLCFLLALLTRLISFFFTFLARFISFLLFVFYLFSSCLWLLYLLLFVDDFSFNLFPLFLIIFDNFEKSFFMRMIHNCHKDRDKLREMRERDGRRLTINEVF